MIYAEFIEHDRSLPVQIFEHLGRQQGWVSDIDVKVANLGRAERIAPEPAIKRAASAAALDIKGRPNRP